MTEKPTDKDTPPTTVKPATGDPKKDDDVTIKQKNTRKIQINVTRDPEINALQKELAELRTKKESDEKAWEEEKKTLAEKQEGITGELKEKTDVLEKQALEKFEAEKAAILKLCQDSGLGEDKIAEVEEKLAKPANLEIVKGLVNMMVALKPKETPDPKEGKGEGKGDKPKKAKVKGKSTFTPPEGAQGYESERAMIDELYEVAANREKKFTIQEQKAANAKIDALFKTLIGSKSWQQMRAGISIGKHTIMACPKCGKTIIGDVPDRCPYCSFNFTKTGDIKAGRS